MKQSILKSVLIYCVFLFSGSVVGQRYFPSVDTYINETPAQVAVVQNTTNFHKLEIRKYTSQNRISFIEFNIGDFSEQVSKAELCLYLFTSTPASKTEILEVYEVTSGVIANSITWSNFNGNYTLSASPVATISITSGATNSASNGWRKLDIKDLVNTVASTPGSDKKIKLALKALNSNLVLDFYSVDATSGAYIYPQYRPTLVLTTAPNASLVEKSRSNALEDGWVGNAFSDNSYDETRLLTSYWKSGETKQYRYANLRFSVPAVTLTENHRVTLKTKVKLDECGTNMNYILDLMGVNLGDEVDVNTLTWNTMPTSENFTYLLSRFFSEEDKTNETSVEWDVTSYVKAQKDASKTYVNFSLQIPELGGAGGEWIAFYATNYLNTEPTSTYIPQLIVYGPDTSTSINNMESGKLKLLNNQDMLSLTNQQSFSGLIFNVQGVIVDSFSNTSSVNISSLSKGVYMLKLSDNSIFKFVKQ
jgi:hypothetical protein